MQPIGSNQSNIHFSGLGQHIKQAGIGLKKIGYTLPTAGKLNPFYNPWKRVAEEGKPAITLMNRVINWDNIKYLAIAATLTRLTTGALRVIQNHPSRLHGNMSENDKHRSYFERIFIEMFGTVGYVFMLHAMQDITAKCLYLLDFLINPSNKRWYDPEQLLDDITHGLKSRKANKALIWVGEDGKEALLFDGEKTIQEIFKRFYVDEKHNTKKSNWHNKWVDYKRPGVIYRVLYGAEGSRDHGRFREELESTFLRETKAGIKRLSPKLSDEAVIKSADDIVKQATNMMWQPFDGQYRQFINRVSRSGTLTILAGMASSVFFGAVIVQFVNDRILSPYLDKYFKRKDAEKASTKSLTPSQIATLTTTVPQQPMQAYRPYFQSTPETTLTTSADKQFTARQVIKQPKTFAHYITSPTYSPNGWPTDPLGRVHE